MRALVFIALSSCKWALVPIAAAYEATHPTPNCHCHELPKDGRAYDCVWTADGGVEWQCAEAAPNGLQCDGGYGT